MILGGSEARAPDRLASPRPHLWKEWFQNRYDATRRVAGFNLTEDKLTGLGLTDDAGMLFEAIFGAQNGAFHVFVDILHWRGLLPIAVESRGLTCESYF